MNCTCELKDKKCKSKIVATKEGALKSINLFQCTKILNTIKNYEKRS